MTTTPYYVDSDEWYPVYTLSAYHTYPGQTPYDLPTGLAVRYIAAKRAFAPVLEEVRRVVEAIEDEMDVSDVMSPEVNAMFAAHRRAIEEALYRKHDDEAPA